MARIQTAKSRKIIDSVSDVQIRNAVRDRVLYLMAEKCGYLSVGQAPYIDLIRMEIPDFDVDAGIVFDYLMLSQLDSMTIEDIDRYKFSDLINLSGG